MRAILVAFDSLNRRHLPPYGCTETVAPNFARLAKATLQFDNAYVCSMPCMPARRDLHTGRPNFLHRAWGPIEPFDDSLPELLQKAGVYTHLITDHGHYFEDGGSTYHNRYSSWEFFRGQEGDKWIPSVAEPPRPSRVDGRNGSNDPLMRANYASRMAFGEGTPMPIEATFGAGLKFLERNHGEDNWFLQLETFDPHEPFLADEEYRKLFPKPDEGLTFDWPPYEKVTESRDHVEHCRKEYFASLAQCDANLGRVLDFMDSHDMWKDTMLIVWTDHGFFLGEREWWGKMRMPWWNELAQIPFFVWDPRTGLKGERRQALVQPAIDMAPTLLKFFGAEPTADMLGKDLAPVIAKDFAVRETCIFGNFGAQVNITDGRHVYMRASECYETPRYEYTYMPTRMMAPFSVTELRGRVEIAPPFSFTKGCSPMRVRVDIWPRPKDDRPEARPIHEQHLLYDLESDPGQKSPVEDPAVEARLIAQLEDHLRACDAPQEQFKRLGLHRA